MKLMEINEEVLGEMITELVEEHIEAFQLEEKLYFMNTRQLEEYVGMSWPTITKVFLGDPDFPILRKGKHYIFHKKELDLYLDRYYEEVKVNGGDVLKYQRRG